MSVLLAACGYAGFAGFMLATLMMLWHAWGLVRTCNLGLLTSDFRFFDRRAHPPSAQPHVRGLIRWFCVAAVAAVPFSIGAASL